MPDSITKPDLIPVLNSAKFGSTLRLIQAFLCSIQLFLLADRVKYPFLVSDCLAGGVYDLLNASNFYHLFKRRFITSLTLR